LRAGQAEVEVMISNPDFPNGKSGFKAIGSIKLCTPDASLSLAAQSRGFYSS
jgi:hypothetical protein